jgi:hypothetical protein
MILYFTLYQLNYIHSVNASNGTAPGGGQILAGFIEEAKIVTATAFYQTFFYYPSYLLFFWGCLSIRKWKFKKPDRRFAVS